MATHTDTGSLRPYKAEAFPKIDGGDARFITNELQKISASIAQLVAVAKLLEARMNTNGLT